VGPEVVKQVHQRLVKLAQANGLAAGRKMRVDTTVVETNVHYQTVRSTGQCNTACSLSAGVSKPKVFRGR
jgi:hypothetical protein